MDQCDARLPGPRCEREAGHSGECYTTVAMPPEAGPALAQLWDEMDDAVTKLERSAKSSRRALWFLLFAAAFNIGVAVWRILGG